MARANRILQAASGAEHAILEESFKTLSEEFRKVEWDRARLEEAISNLDLYLEQQGWSSISGLGGYTTAGPSLRQIHAASKLIRDMSVMSSWVKRGLDLRRGYIWDGGIHYDLPVLEVNKQGKPSNAQVAARTLRDRINDPFNRANFFGPTAREVREGALYCDGQIIYVGDDDTRSIKALPISNVTGYYCNPEDETEVWAYRRSWMDYSADRISGTERSEWIFTNLFWDKGPGRLGPRGGRAPLTSITMDTQTDPVSQTKRLFVRKVNTHDGWVFGTPDAMGGMAWVEQYRQFLLSGKQMSDAMAKIWGVVKVNTQAGANNVMAKMAAPGSSDDSLAVIGTGNSLASLATAGQSYDFEKGIDLLAGFAAAINVSVVALSANPATSGGSYGAAKALDLPEQLTTKARQELHIDLDREVLVWLGADPDIDIWFDPVQDETEKYRGDQRIGLRLGTGLYEGEEIKEMFAAIDGKRNIKPVPDGWLIPNNRESLELRTIDPNVNISGKTGGNPANGGAFASTQGSGAAFTGGGSGDQRSDDLRTEVRRAMREALEEQRLWTDRPDA